MKRIATVYWKDGAKEDIFHNKEDAVPHTIRYGFIEDRLNSVQITHDDGMEIIPLHAIRRIKVRQGR